MGNWAAAGSPLVRPIGLSPTRVSGPAGWFPAVRWPPSDIIGWPPSQLMPPAHPPIYRSMDVKFPELAWDASLFGITVLAEFVQAKVGTQDWLAHTSPGVPDPATIVADVAAELDELQMLVEYRPEVLAEAISQSVDFVGYWAGLLMFSPASHPWTFRLARTAIVVGEFVAMYYKRKWQRGRPSQLSPLLMPPIAVPGHASYPSGHATQAYLVSALLRKVMPPEVTVAQGPAPTSYPTTVPDDLLDRLAQRIARNREVLAMHYPSDSEQGRQLALLTTDLLMQCPLLNTAGTGAIAMAKAEWPVFASDHL